MSPQSAVRCSLLQTGLFGHDRELEMARPVPFFNYIYVRNGGRFVHVTWHQDPPYTLEHAYPLATREQAISITFVPILPHGEPSGPGG